MAETKGDWDAVLVRGWLESRVRSSRLDKAAADREGYAARDDYDKAAAEEWVCRTLAADAGVGDRADLGRRIKALIAQEEYSVTGVNDDVRFERHVRATLRRIARMVVANEGFANTRRYQ